MTITVVVVSYEVRDLLSRCLGSLAAAHQVVVVDNASCDGSAEMVRERFPQVELMARNTNGGFSTAVNQAAKRATGEFLLLLNPDATLPLGAIEAMERLLCNRPTVSAAGFRQVDDKGDFQLALGPPPWLSLEIVRQQLQRRLDGGDARLGRLLDRLLSQPRRVPWVAGSCLLVRQRAFFDVGGFDERFFLFFEDIDFCLRLAARGGQVWYDPSITVIHSRGASAQTCSEAAQRAYRDSQLWFWEKHRGRGIRQLIRVYQVLRKMVS
ncbi:MAG: hypothetical protein A2289_12555 [Deltaproteobacteria bacterium RIFOXYA12_FULL_58_15]|nr:MAG: hypothetical protein A2289_12555 [Deltaproteobacteria bacterium RIFOXYA12_FULL_58_15]OGR09836.1 MAG: hypothetical protein A2341_14410 [Deltaproteobacteria bacterium RIFOXYB12_FULL_58_9]